MEDGGGVPGGIGVYKLDGLEGVCYIVARLVYFDPIQVAAKLSQATMMEIRSKLPSCKRSSGRPTTEPGFL